jgi:hypothetical protein
MRTLKKLLRVNVTSTLKDGSLDVEAAAQRLSRGSTQYNVNPAAFALGVIGALVSALFALNAALRHGPETAPAAPSPAPTETWIDVSGVE